MRYHILAVSAGLNGVAAYLAENSSYVSSSWPALKRFEVVLKLLVPPKPRATDVDTLARVGSGDRGEDEALRKLEGRTVRVARRKKAVEDIGTMQSIERQEWMVSRRMSVVRQAIKTLRLLDGFSRV